MLNVKSEIKPENGIILFLDILGTQSNWREGNSKIFLNKIDTLLEKFEEIKKISEEVLNLHEKQFYYKDIEIKPFANKARIPRIMLDVFNFSDTIIVALYGNKLVSDSFFIYLMGLFLIPIFRNAFEDNILLRGTISTGNFYRLQRKNGILLVGPAVNDAAQSYESTEWIGVSTSPSASLTLEQERKIDLIQNNLFSANINNNKINLGNLFKILSYVFVKYDIPTKNGIEKYGWGLSWPNIFHNSFDSNEKVNNIFNKELSYNKYQKNFIKKEIYIKYKNTKDFYNHILRNYSITNLKLDQIGNKDQSV